jgi:Leucine-rich repeat (LRR) protein
MEEEPADHLSLMPPELLRLMLPHNNVALRRTCRLLRDAYDTRTEHLTIDRALDSHYGHTKCAEVVRRLRRSPGLVSLNVTKQWSKSAWKDVMAVTPALRRLEAASQHSIPLFAARHLEFLDIRDCRVDDLAPLAYCTALRHLDMGLNDEVDDLSPLAACTALRHLDLTGCSAIVDLAPLAACTALRHLVLKQCRSIAYLSPLSALSPRHLDLAGCRQLVDLSPLAACTTLRHLDLTGSSSISDLSPLAACTALQHLVLDGCWSVANIAPLAACTALQFLDINGCWQVTDMTPLLACKALRLL